MLTSFGVPETRARSRYWPGCYSEGESIHEQTCSTNISHLMLTARIAPVQRHSTPVCLLPGCHQSLESARFTNYRKISRPLAHCYSCWPRPLRRPEVLLTIFRNENHTAAVAVTNICKDPDLCLHRFKNPVDKVSAKSWLDYLSLQLAADLVTT